MLGIQAEYEPFDLGPWFPDFLLRGAGTRGDAPAEIKPASTFPHDTAAKIDNAVRGQRQPADRLLLLGVGPFIDGDRLCAGWVRDSGHDAWRPAPLTTRAERWRIGDEPAAPTGWRRVLAAFGRGGPAAEAEDAGAVWRRATNQVQWRPAA